MMKLKSRILSFFRGTANIDKLVKNGLKVGNNLFLGSGCFIDPSHCFLISIGNNVTLSSNVHILAHDASTKKPLGFTKIGQVHIGNNVFVGANTTILPNITIGDNSIIGGGSLVTKSVPENEVWAGNPAKKICMLQDYIYKYEKLRRFDKSYRMSSYLTDEKKLEMIEATSNNFALIE